MKDRLALAMVEGAQADGLVAGTTLVEYTGGSTRPSLAFVCRAKVTPRIVIADCFTQERILLMRRSALTSR